MHPRRWPFPPRRRENGPRRKAPLPQVSGGGSRRSESERILRVQPFLSDATVTAIPDGDGSLLDVIDDTVTPLETIDADVLAREIPLTEQLRHKLLHEYDQTEDSLRFYVLGSHDYYQSSGPTYTKYFTDGRGPTPAQRADTAAQSPEAAMMAVLSTAASAAARSRRA